jgi:hypothetical protein
MIGGQGGKSDPRGGVVLASLRPRFAEFAFRQLRERAISNNARFLRQLCYPPDFLDRYGFGHVASLNNVPPIRQSQH